MSQNDYFPEFQLSEWFRNKEKLEVPVYTFDRCGVVPMKKAYRELIKHLNLDAIVLVDGGTTPKDCPLRRPF